MVRREIGYMRRNGLGVEIALYDTNWICKYPGEKVAALSRLLRDAGIEVAVHGPIHDLNPGSLDVVIRDYTRHCYFKTLAICHALAAKSLVLHLGINPLLPEGALNSWLESSILTWRPLVELAEQLSLTILLENMFVPSPRFLVALKNGLKSDAVKFCFDVGHFNVYSRTSLSRWMDELGADIAEVHLNDNAGLEDEHLALGKGTFDFSRFFRELKARGINPQFTVEMTREKFDASLSYLKENEFIAPVAKLSGLT
jgi:sugar phosphate isomerase/epimerase